MYTAAEVSRAVIVAAEPVAAILLSRGWVLAFSTHLLQQCAAFAHAIMHTFKLGGCAGKRGPRNRQPSNVQAHAVAAIRTPQNMA